MASSFRLTAMETIQFLTLGVDIGTALGSEEQIMCLKNSFSTMLKGTSASVP